MATNDLMKLQHILKALETVETLPPNIASLMIMASKKTITAEDLKTRFKVTMNNESRPLLEAIANKLNNNSPLEEKKKVGTDETSILRGLSSLYEVLNNYNATLPPHVLQLMLSIRGQNVTTTSLAEKLGIPAITESMKPLLEKISQLLNEQING